MAKNSQKYYYMEASYLYMLPMLQCNLCTLIMKQKSNHRTEEEYYIESKRLQKNLRK